MKKYLIIILLSVVLISPSFFLNTVSSVSYLGCYVFNANLKFGGKGVDVKKLQIVLNKDVETKVANSGLGSPDNETEYFGPATKAAVIKFQNKYAADVLIPFGLSKGTGFAGTATRAKLNKLYGCGDSASAPDSSVICSKVNITCADGYELFLPRDLDQAGCPLPQKCVPKTGAANAPSIFLFSPNGGEMFKQKTNNIISWQSQSAPTESYVNLILLEDDREIFSNTFIKTELPATGSFTWLVPEKFCSGNYCSSLRPESNYKIEADLVHLKHCLGGVCTASTTAVLIASDISDAPFRIAEPTAVIIAAPALSIDTGLLPNTSVGQSYLAVIVASGGSDSYAWLVSGSLPPGLEFNGGACVTYPCQAPASISGISNAAGTYAFTVTSISGQSRVSKKFTIGVSETFCGGIGNVECPADFICQLEGDYPDAEGKCVLPSAIKKSSAVLPETISEQMANILESAKLILNQIAEFF